VKKKSKILLLALRSTQLPLTASKHPQYYDL